MTPYQARLIEAERRTADLERRVGRLAFGGTAARQAHVLALAAGENLYRPPPPWLPVGGPARALYRTTACGGSASGVTITTKYAALVLDERRTTGDGYAAFLGVEGVPYTYEVTAPGSGLRATSGSFTMPAGGTTITIPLAVLPPARCLSYCGGTLARPPYRITDPLGSFTRTDDILNFLTFAQDRGGTSIRFTIGTSSGTINTFLAATPAQAGNPPGDAPVSILAACNPFRVTATFAAGAIATFYGVTPTIMTLELA